MRTAQFIRHPTQLGVCALAARQPDKAQSPTAQPRQEALRNLGSAVMGVSKTVPPASTREETSSLQKPTPHAVLTSPLPLLPCVLAFPIRVPLGE